jgi:Galactose oxidase-like, Early set domain
VQAGVNRDTFVFDPSTDTWTPLGRFQDGRREAGGSVLLPGLEKILAVGGSASQTAEVIDTSQASPQWQYVAPLNFVRNHLNLVLLPDGTALAVGGGNDPLPGGPTLSAELYDPTTNTWTVLAAQQYGRQYHSTAVLLPDGRVISGGGEGTPGDTSVEIYSPPYLFQGPRPKIKQAPTEVTYGQTFSVSSRQAAEITKVVMMRPGATTHGFDQDQRYVGLSFSVVNGKLRVTAPANGEVAPPGWYMLFLVNLNGVPSVAKFVHVV